MGRYGLLVILVAATGGCGGGSGSAPDGGDAGPARDAGREGGPGDGGGVGDAAADAGPSDDAGGEDAGDPDACVPEGDEVLCEAADAQCGEVETTDRCGASRTARCGDCPGLQSCGARGADNRCDWESWDIETVDAADDAGLNLAMALGSEGRPWIAYRANDVGDALRVARLEDGGSWTVETLEESLLIAQAIAIALDPSGNVQVASAPASPLEDGSTPKLDVHVFEDEGWTREPIDGGSSPEWLGLAFDADGDRHFCAYQAPGGGFGGYLEHMEETSDGSYDTTTVDGAVGSSESRKGNYCSIAVDGDGVLHLSYEDAQFGRLMYAANEGSGWSEEPVDAPDGDTAGAYADMALDPSGTPVITYRAGSTGDREIRVATPDGESGWSLATVEPDAGIIANHTAVDVDGSGVTHVAYFDSREPGTLHYAHDGDDAWTIEEVAVMGTGSGGYSDIAVDGSGVVHIAFYDARMGELRYARRVE